MITVYELKHSRACRCFFRTPFYIKNLFLLSILALLLSVIYMIYFRRDGMVYQNIPKILKGLNSNTFNYLDTNRDSLRLTQTINNYPAQFSSNAFMADCLRINKPCKFEQLAQTWPAFDKWRFTADGNKYLEKKLKDQMTVYVDLDSDVNIGEGSGDSFNPNTQTMMKYSEFIQKMSSNQVEVALKDDIPFDHPLKADVAEPGFLSNVAELSSIDLIQGQTLISSAHYERHEQVLCTIDGSTQVKLVPHIYKQEVYAGKKRALDSQDANTGRYLEEEVEPNYSPVNFFEPDFTQYPLFAEVGRKYNIQLKEGDCMFIPAFYFYQYVARPLSIPERKGVKPSALLVNLNYPSNSGLLSSFFDAIELQILN